MRQDIQCGPDQDKVYCEIGRIYAEMARVRQSNPVDRLQLIDNLVVELQDVIDIYDGRDRY